MKAILSRLFNHEELNREEAKNLLLNITKGRYNDSQIAALLTVFQMRGVKVEELIGFREALLTTRVPIDFSAYKPIDIVGTGGDGKNTFNISTCACLIVAGAGYHVAKHGNYGATSISGASNVMEQHGVKFTNDPSILTRSMEECGMVYARPAVQSCHEKRRSGTQSPTSADYLQSSRTIGQPLPTFLPIIGCGRSSSNAPLHQCIPKAWHRFCRSQ